MFSSSIFNISNTKLNKAVGGAVFSENNNNSFLKLENVYSTTIYQNKEEKNNLVIPVGFGLAYKHSPNQLYCSLVSISKELKKGFYNIEEEEENEKIKENNHSFLKIKNFHESLPNLTTLPQYFRAFAEPLGYPLLQCIIEQLAKQCFGNTFNIELNKNMTVDLYYNSSELEEFENKLWRDYSGFIIIDRFRYYEIKIKSSSIIELFKNNKNELLNNNYSIISLNSQTKNLFLIYDQNICSIDRENYFEFLLSLNGINGLIAINNKNNQPLGYLIALNNGKILQCYSDNEKIANLLLYSLINNKNNNLIYSMFIRINSEEKEEENNFGIKLIEKADNVFRICRYHSRIFPTNIEWSKIFILNIGANLF